MARTPRSRQRAAVSAARKSRSSRGWYILSAAVVIVGVFLIVVSRTDPVAPLANQDHWHSAFGVNVCGEWLPAIPEFETAAQNSAQRTGIHTHGDGLIHTHPFVNAESGNKATVGKFLEYAGAEASKDSFNIDGTEHKTGDKCGDKEAVVRWELNGKPQSGNISSYHQKDGDIIARLALLPEDDEIGEPPSAAQMADPLAAEEGRELIGGPTSLPPETSPETAAPGETTVPGETAAPTETTTGETATTVAP